MPQSWPAPAPHRGPAPAGTTRLTSPYSAASRADSISPSSSISMARLRGTLRDSATMGVEQKRPMLTPGVANLAVSDATARSQVATSWQPAAVAMPSTAAITGFGQRRSDCMNVAHSRIKSSVKPRPPSGSSRCSVSSLRSCPAQNAGPLPAMTTARIPASAEAASIAPCSAASIALDRLLRASGLARVSTRTPASGRSISTIVRRRRLGRPLRPSVRRAPSLWPASPPSSTSATAATARSCRSAS